MLEGPGVDQDPKGLFEIDDKTGWIKSKRPLDREKHRSFMVNIKMIECFKQSNWTLTMYVIVL